MYIGIDYGTSSIKVSLIDRDPNTGLIQTTFTDWIGLMDRLAQGLNIEGSAHTGLGRVRHGEEMTTPFPSTQYRNSETIEDEVQAQAEGTRFLLKQQGYNLNDYLLVSMGSGISYTAIGKNGVFPAKFGNPLGGCFLAMMRLFLNNPKVGETSADLYYRDLMPHIFGTENTKDTIGCYVGSHFSGDTSPEARMLSSIDVLPVQIVLALMDSISLKEAMMSASGESLVWRAVFIGGVMEHNPEMQERLKFWMGLMDKEVHCFHPENGKYAASLGAALWAMKYQ